MAANHFLLSSLTSISMILPLKFLTRPLVYGIFLLAPPILFSRTDLSVLHWFFKTNPLVSMVLTLVFNLTFLATSLSTTLFSFGFSVPT